MTDKPMGEIRRLRMEVARLEDILTLQQGGIREAYRILARANGGCVARAKTELARFVPEDELETPKPPCT